MEHSPCECLHLDIEQILAAGDSHVIVRWRSRGTHLGTLADIPATGRKASNHGCTVIEIKNNKIGHAWVYFDNAHLLRQIGVLVGAARLANPTAARRSEPRWSSMAIRLSGLLGPVPRAES